MSISNLCLMLKRKWPLSAQRSSGIGSCEPCSVLAAKTPVSEVPLPALREQGQPIKQLQGQTGAGARQTRDGDIHLTLQPLEASKAPGSRDTQVVAFLSFKFLLHAPWVWPPFEEHTERCHCHEPLYHLLLEGWVSSSNLSALNSPLGSQDSAGLLLTSPRTAGMPTPEHLEVCERTEQGQSPWRAPGAGPQGPRGDRGVGSLSGTRDVRSRWPLWSLLKRPVIVRSLRHTSGSLIL